MSPPSCRSPSPLINQQQDDEAPSSRSHPPARATTTQSEGRVILDDDAHHKDYVEGRLQPLPKLAVALEPAPARGANSSSVVASAIGNRFRSLFRILIDGMFRPLVSSLRSLASSSSSAKGESDAENSDATTATTTTRHTPDIPTPPPSPHGQWTHPHKTVTDKIASAVVMRLLPLDRLAERCREGEPIATAKLVTEVRRGMLPDQLKSNDRSLARLEKARSWGSLSLNLRRDPGLLVRWGVVEEAEPPWRRKTTKEKVGCDVNSRPCDRDGDHSYVGMTDDGEDERRGGKSTAIGADDSCVTDSSTDHNHDHGEDDDDPARDGRDSFVEVILYGPSSILPASSTTMAQPVPTDSSSNSSVSAVDLDTTTNDGVSALRGLAMKLEEVHRESAKYAENRARKMPIIIWFHGGGMMFGTSRDGRALDLARDVLKRQDEDDGKNSINNRSEVLLVGVEMGLAPERVFPWGLVDCLSVIESVLRIFQDVCGAEVHVAGESAGGNYACVSAMECHRRFPGKIKSAFIMQPMLVPEANSMSYHMNGPTSGFCPVPWLRWAWQVYLRFDEDDDNDDNDNNNNDNNEESRAVESCGGQPGCGVGTIGSGTAGANCTNAEERDVAVLSEAELSGSAAATAELATHPTNLAVKGRPSRPLNGTSRQRWRRLYSPQVDLPLNLRGDRDSPQGWGVTVGGSAATPVPVTVTIPLAPRFIVVTSLADPLRDDGALLVGRLRQKGADVRHVESTGSHVIGPSMDGTAWGDAMDAWRDALLGR